MQCCQNVGTITPNPVPGTPLPERNPTKGVFTSGDALPYKATAGTSGYLGRAEQARTTTDNQNPPAAFDPHRDRDDFEALGQAVKVFVFRNMTVLMDALKQIMTEPGLEKTWKWDSLVKTVEKMHVDWQGSM